MEVEIRSCIFVFFFVFGGGFWVFRLALIIIIITIIIIFIIFILLLLLLLFICFLLFLFIIIIFIIFIILLLLLVVVERAMTYQPRARTFRDTLRFSLQKDWAKYIGTVP